MVFKSRTNFEQFIEEKNRSQKISATFLRLVFFFSLVQLVLSISGYLLTDSGVDSLHNGYFIVNRSARRMGYMQSILSRVSQINRLYLVDRLNLTQTEVASRFNTHKQAITLSLQKLQKTQVELGKEGVLLRDKEIDRLLGENVVRLRDIETGKK